MSLAVFHVRKEDPMADSADEPNRIPEIAHNDTQIMSMDTSEQLATDQEQEQVTHQMQMLYHQNPTPLSQRVNTRNLWNFPDPAGQGMVVSKAHPIAKQFHQTCALIRKHWKLDPKHIVPEEMRAYTPYSLALTLALRRCASHTKQEPLIAEEAIRAAWRQRTGDPLFDGRSVQVFKTRVEDVLFNPAFCEEVIQECSHGLTLADVNRVGKLVVSEMKQHKARLPQPSGQLRGGDRAANKAAKKAARAEKKAKQQDFRDKGLKKRQEAAASFETQKVAKRHRKKAAKASNMESKMNGQAGYKLLEFLSGKDDEDDGGGVTLTGLEYGTVGDEDAASVAPPNSPTEQSVMAQEPSLPPSAPYLHKTKRQRRQAQNSDPVLSADPDLAVHASNRDRHNDNVLSQMFNRVDMDSTRALQAKKAKRLMASAAKYEGVLPNQKMKLAEIPTLYAQQGMKLQDEASEVLSKMQLEGEAKDGGDGEIGGEQGGVAVGGDEEEL